MLKINQNMFKRLMLLECDSLSFISGFEASQCDWVEFDHEESNPGRKEMQADRAILILPPPPPPPPHTQRLPGWGAEIKRI